MPVIDEAQAVGFMMHAGEYSGYLKAKRSVTVQFQTNIIQMHPKVI